MLPPADVLAYGRRAARAAGIDAEDGESFAAEAWATFPPQMWHTVTRRWCVNERRKVSGRGNGPDRRPVVVFDQPVGDDDRDAKSLGDLLTAGPDPDLEQAETRVDLVAALVDLDDGDLAALARAYWLGLGARAAQVPVARAIRHARANRAPAGEPPRERMRHRTTDQPLTAAETNILTRVAQGMTNQQIAADLTVSVNTVKTTLKNASASLGASDRAHAVALAIRAGLI